MKSVRKMRKKHEKEEWKKTRNEGLRYKINISFLSLHAHFLRSDIKETSYSADWLEISFPWENN